MTEHQDTTAGTVYIVGAGPGASDLITLRGVECLRRADVVLYDYLVNPSMLQHAPRDTQRICLGRHGHTRIWSQSEINDHMVKLALAGKTVVRLKGGDPAIFARVTEETDALRQNGVPFEIVPGITAALAAGSFAGLPITHRNFASAVALVTGQENTAKAHTALDYASLAKFPGTLVFYMGVTTAETWSSALIQGGKSPATPTMIVRRCSLADQQTISCTLGDLTNRLTSPVRIRPPAVIIVGAVAGLALQPSWFEHRPLFGQTVMVTRPIEQSAALGQLLEEQGAEVICQPAIEIRGPENWVPVDDTLTHLDRFDWVVFSSVNGVRAFLDRLAGLGRDLRSLGGVRLAAIGPATADQLRQSHLQPDCQPERFQAEDLADALVGDACGKSFLLIRASRGRELLAERLVAAGAIVTQVVAYRSTDVLEPNEPSLTRLAAGQIDWVTVTSSAIAHSLVNMFSDELSKTRLASISPVTSQTLRNLGFEPTVEAREATMRGVVDAIQNSQ